MIQTIHNRYDDAVAVEQRIINANAAVAFVELLSFAYVREVYVLEQQLN